MRGDLRDFGLEVYLGEWEFAAAHHLTASDAQTLTVAEVLGPEGLEELARLGLGYTPTWGTAALREAVAATYETLEPEDVLVFAAPGRRVPEPEGHERLPILVGAERQQLADRQRLGVGRGQVMAGLELPLAEVDLEAESGSLTVIRGSP